MKEKYIPTPAEEKEAEHRLTKTQRESSDIRAIDDLRKEMENAGLKGYLRYDHGDSEDDDQMATIEGKINNVEIFLLRDSRSGQGKYSGDIHKKKLTGEDAKVLWNELIPYTDEEPLHRRHQRKIEQELISEEMMYVPEDDAHKEVERLLAMIKK